MNLDFTIYQLSELIELHQRADGQLKEALLQGASWEEVQEQKAYVTQLAIAIHQVQTHSGKHQLPLIYPCNQQG